MGYPIFLIKEPEIFNIVDKDKQYKFLELCKFKYRNFLSNLKCVYHYHKVFDSGIVLDFKIKSPRDYL